MSTYLKPLVAVALAGAVSAAFAAPQGPEFGNVISAKPIVVQSTVPTQQCEDQPGFVQTPTSGGGAVVGGILGGLAGHAIGAGVGRAVATGVGAIAGAVVGNNVEAYNTPPTPVTTTNCVYSRSTQPRVVGYDVAYEFNGQTYTTRTLRDPGARIALDVRPAGEASPYDAPATSDLAQATAAQSYPSGYPSSPAYGAPYPAPYPVPNPAYPDTTYGYPAYGYGSGFYGGVSVPLYIDGRFGGGRGRHWH